MADNVKLVLEFDATGAIQNVKNFGSNLKKETSEASSAFDGLNSKMVAVGAAIATYFTASAIKGFFGAIISESMEAEENLNQLNGALKRAGTYSAESSQAMQDFATSMMNLTTIDDDVILGQLAIARNFTKTDEEARKLITAAADLSAAMGTDLGTATELLGRSLDGTAGRLNETVPALRGVSEEALKAGAAIDIVGAAFEGAAGNKVQTFEGALQRLGNAFGNLKAAMGDAITQNPVFIAAINELSGLFVTLTGRASDSKDGIISWVNDGILSMIDGIRNVLPYINELMSFLKSLSAILVILKEGFMGALDTLVLLGSGIGMLVEKFTGGQKSAFMFGAALDDMSKRADTMKEALDKIGTDTFSKIDLKKIDEAFARIADAAKKNPIEIKANLNTNKIKDDLKNATGELEVEAKKKADSKPEDVLFPPEQMGFWEEAWADFKKYMKGFFEKFSSDLIAVSPVLGKSLLFLGAGLVDAAIGVIGLWDQARNSIFDAWMKDNNGHVDYLESQDKDGNIKMIENPTKGDRNFPARPNDNPLTQASERFIDVFRNVDWLGLSRTAVTGLKNFALGAADFTARIAEATIMAGVNVAGTAVTSVIGNIGKGEAGAKPAIVETMGAIGAAFDKALGTGNMIADVLKTFLNTLTDPEKMKALIDGFIDAIPVVIDAMIEAIPTLMDGIVRALPILLDGIIKLIPEIMQETARTIGPILKILADKIPDIIIAISENTAPIVEAIIDAMPSVLIKLIGALPRVLGSLIKTIAKIYWDIWWKGIPALLEGITTGISKALSNIGSGLNMGGMSSTDQWGSKAQTYVANFMTALIKAVSDIPVLIGQLFKNIGAAIGVAFQQVIDAIVRFGRWLANLGSVLWNDGVLPLLDSISLIGQNIGEAFKSLGGSASIDMESLRVKIINGITSIFNTLSIDLPKKLIEGIQSLVTWFASVGATIWNQGVIPLVNWFSGLGTKLWNQGVLPLVNFFKTLGTKLWEALQQGLQQLTGGGGKKSKSGGLIPGYATGGVVPKGYPNDSYPALLTSGETVVPADSASNLFKAIDALSQGGGTSSKETNALLRQLIALIASQETTVNVQLDRNVLAKAILTLNKDNRRIA